MSTALAVKPVTAAAIEAALVMGDLDKLDTPGRLSYYKQVCESLGLNPLTRPFDYIRLNNKLTLYAKRDCTDQLRKIHGVSISNLKAEQIGDVYVVTASAIDADQRIDTSTGAVCIAGLTGDSMANALMKAETKAKRRVTLSLCGLGLLDETEVETIPDAKPDTGPQTVVVEPVQTIPPTLEGNKLKATVLKVEERMSKGQRPKAFFAVKIAGRVQNKDLFFCWHVGLSYALGRAEGKVCQFEIMQDGDYLNIADVLAIGDQEYRDGKPYNAEPDQTSATANPEITDADLPSTLFED